jgi:pilus assembly protein CpaF
MLSRLEMMTLMGIELPLPAVRRQIASGIDIIIHVGRLRDRSRKVLQVLEILGYDSAAAEIRTQILYEFEEEGEDACGNIRGHLVKRQALARQLKLQRAGYRI